MPYFNRALKDSLLTVRLAYSQTLSLWRAGAIRVLVFALVIAVAAMTAVGFFTQRVESALNQQGGLLLGGDIALQADHAIAETALKNAQLLNLNTVKTYEFPSMVIQQDNNQLAEIKAVGTGFPLRGDLTIQNEFSPEKNVTHGPAIGEAWVEPRLANLLSLKVGGDVSVGEKTLRVSAILLHEPSRGGDMFSFAPRLMMHTDDLAATKLIQFGSRVKYQLLLAGAPQNVNTYLQEAKANLGRGEKIEDVRNARPEIKSALDKAQQFLGLSAMVSVVLAMVAMLLSSLPYIKQSLDTFALMRCFGASQKKVMQLLILQTLIIAILSALVGVWVGYLAQLGLAAIADGLFLETLPHVSYAPAFVGIFASIAMMVAVVMPHAWQMRQLTAMNILRRDTLPTPFLNNLKFIPAASIMLALVFWQANDVKIATSTALAALALCAFVTLLAYAVVRLINHLFLRFPRKAYIGTGIGAGNLSAIKIGLQNIRRRFALSVMQMIGFSLGLMVLILLALVQGDLIRNWQASLPSNAPNRFVINIQPEQIAGVKTLFKQQNIAEADVFPMVRGRLISINAQPITNKVYTEERAKRLAEREFNLSWAAKMQTDNALIAGRWWTAADHGKPYISLEQELAKSLGIQLNDTLVFDIAGNLITLKVTSLRKVDWDTMRANFFAVTPPGVLNDYAANYISSFHLPPQADAPLNALIKSYPNLTVIDIAALMQQVRGIMQKMSSTIAYVFIFSLVAGTAVLYSALVATERERILEATLMRIFGASRRQVVIAYLAEFACIGLIAAIVAVAAANALAYYMSAYLLNIPFQFNLSLAFFTMLVATLLIPFAAWLGLRSSLNIPPRQLLNSI